MTPPIIDPHPWQPFLSCMDFEFAELAHDAAVSKDQIDQFFQLVQKITHSPLMFSFKSHADVAKAWEHACMQMTPVSCTFNLLSFDKFDHSGIQYVHPTIVGLGNGLAPHFVWDAQCLYKHNGEHFEHFIHEPWTANCWWNLQVCTSYYCVVSYLILN
ncbi:hypothetical protein BS17DRAFT_706213 [Gyrodon lividus]|nr:hypothetical protein BS17DRAFT_706213 [Gyrodon lividus]